MLYYALTTFCPTTAVESVQQALARYSSNQIVVETPDGKTLSVDIPIATPAAATGTGSGENGINSTITIPTTSIVVDTPSGPSAIVVPVVQPGEPSTTVVVDTPTGPVVLEVPLTKPGNGDGSDAQQVSPDDAAAVMREFEHQMTAFFEDEITSLVAAANEAETEEADIAAHNEALDDCIAKAANKVLKLI